eukprot:5411492-Pyramimonas_sp.AAC.1
MHCVSLQVDSRNSKTLFSCSLGTDLVCRELYDVETVQTRQDEAEMKMSELQEQYTKFKQGGSSSAA